MKANIWHICSNLFFNWLKYKCLELSSTIFSHCLWRLRSIAAYCSSAVPKWILPHCHLFIRVGGICDFPSWSMQMPACAVTQFSRPMRRGSNSGLICLECCNSFAFFPDFIYLFFFNPQVRKPNLIMRLKFCRESKEMLFSSQHFKLA